MKKIWGVSDGDYSDYSVCCLCSSEELAKELAAKLGYRVEEFPYVESMDDSYEFTIYYAEVNFDGTTHRTWEYVSRGVGEIPEFRPYESAYAATNKGVIGYSHRSPEAALRVAIDHLTAKQAKEAGF